MFCTKCGNKVQSSFRFCPECGNNLSALSQTENQDVTETAHPLSATGAEEHHLENEDKGSLHVDCQEQPENTAKKKGQCNDATPDNVSSDNTAATVTVETSTTSSSLDQMLSDDQTTRSSQDEQSQKEEKEFPETCALHRDPQSCIEAACGSDNLTGQQIKAQSNVSTDDCRVEEHRKSEPLSSISALPSDKETDAPELSEQIPEQGDTHTKHRAERRSGDESKNVNQAQSEESDSFSPETDREAQPATDKPLHSDEPRSTEKEFCDHQSSATKETATKAANTKSGDKAHMNLPGTSDGDPGRSPKRSNTAHHSNVDPNSLRAAPISTPQDEFVSVYFHAVTSKDFHLDPRRDFIFLRSEKIFGSSETDGLQMSFSNFPVDEGFLVLGHIKIPRDKINEGIPYKYFVYIHNGTCPNGMSEFIYPKNLNRCLSIKQDLLTPEGEWHQYDDMIYPEIKKGWAWDTTKAYVVEGRDKAGGVMLQSIFDLLTTWNKPNVENFFFLLQQFFHTYSYPQLHAGMAQPWGLPYNKESVKCLLKAVLKANLNLKPGQRKEKPESPLHPFRVGVIGLIVSRNYLGNDIEDVAGLCNLLCLPLMPKDEFLAAWKDFTQALPDQKDVAKLVENLCQHAREKHIQDWILATPAIHLLSGQSKPYEPVPPVLHPEYDSKKKNSKEQWNLLSVMRNHAYLAEMDGLLGRSWMSLLALEDLFEFMSFVDVELLDILCYMQFRVKSWKQSNSKNEEALRKLAGHLIQRVNNQENSYDDKYGECCLKTAVTLLGSICCRMTQTRQHEIPLDFLHLVSLIAKAYDCNDSQSKQGIHKVSIEDTLKIMREWQRKVFQTKLLNERDRAKFNVPQEIDVWNRLMSLSFGHKDHTSHWQTCFQKDFEHKLKQEEPVDQIGIYCNKMEELSKTNPLLWNTMENCALEAVSACQHKSGRALSDLLARQDIKKFGKLLSSIVLTAWPTNTKREHIEDEESVFDYLLNWPMTKTVFQIEDVKMTTEAKRKKSLASSVFRRVSAGFLSGDIQIKTLKQILQNEHVFVDLLKIDGLCDDGRCKDQRNMSNLLKHRRAEAEAVSNEKELAKSLLQTCMTVPQHVKVDFMGLDNKLQHNTEMMRLNEFMEVHTLDGQMSSSTGKVTYFTISDSTRQMADDLLAIKDSLIFTMYWTNKVEELNTDHANKDDTEPCEEIYTLELIWSKIFQSCYRKYKELYASLSSGKMSLVEIDSFFEDYKGENNDLEKDLEMLCRTNPSDDRQWVKKRIEQIKQYRDLSLAVESAKIIKDIRNILCPQGDFTGLERLLQMNEAEFKQNCLNDIDDNFMEVKRVLEGITVDHRHCLKELSLRQNFILWVKGELKGINELKVFVDLASISAGENDLDVDRVACFHDAVLGYSSMLYGLEPNSDYEAFKESMTKLWKALQNDKALPIKLGDTARHLDWLKHVKESHGSVELSSLSLATSINERGMYIIKPQNNKKLTVETSLILQLQGGREKTMKDTYELEDLKELQNKLMLMSGRGEQNHSEVDQFAEVFDNVQRLAKTFVTLYAAGNPLFRCWEAKIYCKQSDPCITMELNFCETQHLIKVCGHLVEQLTALSTKMELFLDDWRKFIDEQRSDHCYLNFFTAEQIVYLCSVLTPANVNSEIEDKALMMLSFIQPNYTASDLWKSWARFHNQFEPGKRKNDHIHFQSLFTQHDDRHMSTTDNPADTVNQTVGLTELEELWNGYMNNKGIFFHDFLDIRSLGSLLEMISSSENQIEDDLEEPVPLHTRDTSISRNIPKALSLNRPNLLICPQDEILTSSICLYMHSEDKPLPSYDEVLMCTPSTTYEQVELFMRRCLTQGYPGQKMYTMLWADLLNYDVSYAMERCFQRLTSNCEHKYMLVIFCSSNREHTYVPTAFSQYKRDFVPQEPLEKIQKYLSRNYNVPSDDSNAQRFKGGQSVGIVSSRRAGVGKSLYVQRLYERLEGSVDGGTAFKKCIRLTEHKIDEHKVLQSLYDTPKDKDLKVFHIDVTSSVQKGLNEFLYKIFFLQYLMDSEGMVWHCNHKHLYIVELLESTHDQPTCTSRTGQKETIAFSDVFPKILCRPPKEVMTLEKSREDNTEAESDLPLMDDKCFKSEAFQRPYQYLKRVYNHENLDKFTYKGTEGTHAECLQIFLFYCGIIDPSWAELRNFVWFLNLQLLDCEKSVFCNFDLVGDTLHGFKNFVVEFMILMSKDFATPSLCMTDQSPGKQLIDLSGCDEKDLAPFLIRKRWESEPHPYIFFNNDHESMTFIGFHLQPNGRNGIDAINPSTRQVIKENIMSRQLYTGLLHQRVPFNEDFERLSRAEKLKRLCSVLGTTGQTDPDETYELTIDNILKMMAIHMRFRCGIPVIIMGETGCGKTRLIKFLCELGKCGANAENMKLVKVHGGTTSEMIHQKVKEAETLAKENIKNHNCDSVLFIDEANTTEAISSIKEIICDNTVQGQELGSQTGLQIIAACNPYRKHTEKMIERLEASGLGYRVRAEETEDKLGSVPLRQLVYRVHALPPSMIPLVWDFGQLNNSTEQMYIQQIVERRSNAHMIEKCYMPTVTKVLSSSQNFMRARKDECSFVSLRDVERCMQVFVWFHEKHPMFAEKLEAFLRKSRKPPSFPPASDRVIWSLLMATGVCYQSSLEDKHTYQNEICKILPGEYTPLRVRNEIQLMHDLLLSGVRLGKAIAKNEALKENFFMMVICIELKIPLFIVGKPGSSKSLSKTLVAEAMQGPASHSELFQKLKQIHLVSFQCSPHSTPKGIIGTFKQCARFQESKNLNEYVSIVVLDEIGLAEDSPKMPLKTLHPLLEEGCIDDEPKPHKRVGFIGISNWALDPAKMNRGIFVSRGDPNEKELIKSAEGICSSEVKVLEKIKTFFKPFAQAYMRICEKGSGFFGLRDFYSLIKMLFSFAKARDECPTPYEITHAVLRNFSGRDDVDVIGIFREQLPDGFTDANICAIDLVAQSISPVHCQTDESRYLLILTKNYAALQILQQTFFSPENPQIQIQPEIIFGSSFPKDQEYTQICRNINRVKICMETGQTVVLLNLQNLYESLYDALNQYYVTLGGQKYVDLGLGTHRVKCRVHKNFKLIVIEEKEVVYKHFPIPLINRLEKHYLDINTVLRNEQKDIAEGLKTWVDDFICTSSDHTTKQYVPSDVFIGYHSDTCSSVVLQVMKNQNDEADAPCVLDKAKRILLNCATPDAVVRLDKSILPEEERVQLMTEYAKEGMHRSLGDYIAYHTQTVEQSQCYFTEVTTFSRLLTAADTQELQDVIKLDDIKILSLHQFDTEYSFLKKIRECLGSTHADKILFFQMDYDEDSHSGNILSSAKYSCINEIRKWTTTDSTKIFVYFVTKLPRIVGGTSYVGFPGGPWRSVHIDDLRRSKEFVSDVHSLKDLCISELFQDPPQDDIEVEEQNVLAEVFNTNDLVRSCVQSAVSMLRDEVDSGVRSAKRVENLLTLLHANETEGVFENIVRKRLHVLLESYEANLPFPKNWVLHEASNVKSLQEGGTFVHTLWKKIQTVVTPLLANVISVIDRDCNLDLLLDIYIDDNVRNLWLEIFGCKEMLDVPYVKMESKSEVFVVQSHITADNTMRCVMPFSWWIKDFLDVLMMRTSRQENHLEELFLNTPLGAYMAKLNDKTMEEFFQRYLQDFVSMTMKVATQEELQVLHHALTSCVNEVWRRKRDDRPSLLQIHSAYQVYKGRLQNLLRMISLLPQIVSPLLKNQQIRDSPEMVLDVHAAMACVESLEPTLDTDSACQDWLKQVKRLQGSMEMIYSRKNTKLYGHRCKERLSDIRNGWKCIHILSLFVEHMLLGFQNEEKELRTLVQNSSHTLSRVLSGNSDVKSWRAFQAVIEELKSCMQGASDLIWKFGLQCTVCMAEPQDPVQMPCLHICCLTCMKEVLDAGPASCPNCRQQLPNDFSPHVSESMRASLKRNAEFRRRCNGFFIDLLSTVCFKDNAPPTGDVITHLLSYLKIETGDNQQTQTKALSPFDDSLDKNPVVRSVILKLLLKFSFDQVKEYLQRHLSSVESSSFVDDTDKAELYALYINCLEDSMWEKLPQENSKAEVLLPFLSNETGFLQHFLTAVTSVPATESIQHLQCVARLRVSLTMASQLICDGVYENNIPDAAQQFLNALTELCEQSGNDWYRVYLIRKLGDRQGVEKVQTLVKDPQFSWLFPAEIQQQNEDGGQMDKYLVYGDEYRAVRDAVAKAVVDGSIEMIEDVCEKCTAPPRKRTMFILLALYREVTTLYRSANTGLHPTAERCQQFAELIEGSSYLPDKQVRDFALAVVQNSSTVLKVHSDLSVTDHTVIELAVHMAAVLLTGINNLLEPLKQLGLSPQNMQKSFLPTMPDDMFAVVEAVMKEAGSRLTWYECSNGHPCFVDQCGMPTEEGKCPVCKEVIGGLRHKAVPGFKKRDHHQDDTKPGHILGDPEKRDNLETPDNKNMTLTSFTLIRLVTHLAMLLGTSENMESVGQIIRPPVQDVCLFLTRHLLKDLDQLSQSLGKGADDFFSTIHLVLKSLPEPMPTDHPVLDPFLTTKESRNTWETTVASELMTPLLMQCDQLLQEANAAIRNDSRVSSNFIMRVTFTNDCTFLASLPQNTPVHSSAVWSCRHRLSLLSLTCTMENNELKEKLPLLWRFLHKEREFRQIKLLPEILTLQRHLVRKFQNATDQISGSIGEFIESQSEMRSWYEVHIHNFLKTWNMLRVSVTNSEMEIPTEFCSADLDLSSGLQYLLPQRKGPGLCATALVSYLVTLHNQLVDAVDNHTGEDSSGYKVSVAMLMEQHVIQYDLEKDLLPLVLSNCQYSLERGHETISEYDLPRIQRQILTRFLQGKPYIQRIGVPTLINTHEANYEAIFRAVKGRVPQEPLNSLLRNSIDRVLVSCSEVCDALKLVELLLEFLSMTGGDPTMPLVAYLQDTLKMAITNTYILQALGRCTLKHCVNLWQLLSSLKSERMLHLNREPFSDYPVEYQALLTESEKTQVKRFVSGRNVDSWFLEIHEFLLLKLGSSRAPLDSKPFLSVKDTVMIYMDDKDVAVPAYVDTFPENVLLSQIVATWKYFLITKQEQSQLMNTYCTSQDPFKACSRCF
ncbi:E3 ubiquitin-protein ligase rnf213-alpha-like isoform X2 [Genypterus blacodes]|uniref:E3 ubiquitin-protein ligase rnf213-alpha-like isoform X2 n=1 Tax=Genypterus blacodes TaxID=154954 RepID=UPI003F766141